MDFKNGESMINSVTHSLFCYFHGEKRPVYFQEKGELGPLSHFMFLLHFCVVYFYFESFSCIECSLICMEPRI